MKHYRQLSAAFATFLEETAVDGSDRWPDYKSLQIHAAKRRWAFSTREYASLRKHHIGAGAIVEALIDFFVVYRLPELDVKFGETISVNGQLIPLNELFDRLSSVLEYESLRTRNFYFDLSWREFPLLLLVRDWDGYEDSFCRDEQDVEEIAKMSFAWVGKAVLRGRHRIDSKEVIKAGEEHLRRTQSEHIDNLRRWWSSVPECIWLTKMGNKMIGASVILPLTDSAYERVRAGELTDKEVSPQTDLRIPSRSLLLLGSGRLGWSRPPRFGLRHSLQCLVSTLQQLAVLIYEREPQAESVRLLCFGGTPKTEKTLKQFGFSPTGTKLCGFDIEVYELVFPSPEFACRSYLSPQSMIASFVGLC